MLAVLRDNWRHNQKLRFLVVGVWNTVFGYGLFLVFYWFAAAWLHYAVIATSAHFAAVTQSFVSQRMFVFGATASWLSQYWRFQVASLAALGFNLALLAVLVEGVKLHVLLAQALATALSVVVSYVLHKYYSFRESR